MVVFWSRERERVDEWLTVTKASRYFKANVLMKW